MFVEAAVDAFMLPWRWQFLQERCIRNNASSHAAALAPNLLYYILQHRQLRPC